MALDTLSSREHQVELFERYSGMLTALQRDVLELHLRRDWSLAEIARHREISRAAVHDLVRRGAQAMEDCEEKLGLLAAGERRREALALIAAELADLRRRLAGLELRLVDV